MLFGAPQQTEPRHQAPPTPSDGPKAALGTAPCRNLNSCRHASPGQACRSPSQKSSNTWPALWMPSSRTRHTPPTSRTHTPTHTRAPTPATAPPPSVPPPPPPPAPRTPHHPRSLRTAGAALPRTLPQAVRPRHTRVRTVVPGLRRSRRTTRP